MRIFFQRYPQDRCTAVGGQPPARANRRSGRDETWEDFIAGIDDTDLEVHHNLRWRALAPEISNPIIQHCLEDFFVFSDCFPDSNAYTIGTTTTFTVAILPVRFHILGS